MTNLPLLFQFHHSSSPLHSSLSNPLISSLKPSHSILPSHRSHYTITSLSSTPPPPPSDDQPPQNPSPTPSEQEQQQQQSPPEPTNESPSPSSDDADDGISAMLNSPEFLSKKLEIVQKELSEQHALVDSLQAELKSEKDSYLRLAADLENFRKRSRSELNDSSNRATVTVLKQLLNVLDNFELAENAVNPKTDAEKAIKSSYSALNKQLLDMLVKLNVEPIETIGAEFDPMVMEAIQMQQSTEYAENKVLYQMKRGYKLGELVVRPALVVVSSGPGPDQTESAETPDNAAEPGSETAAAAPES